MAVLRVKTFSETLKMQVNFNVVHPQRSERFPEALETPPAILYLLHGWSDNQDTWLDGIPVERYINERHANLIVVMPYGARSFYLNEDGDEGYGWFDFISEELPATCRQFFRFDESKTYAAGFSMGGYGALRLGLTYPERYKKVFAFAPAAGSHLGENSLLKFPVAGKPELAITVGTEDFLLEECRALNAALKPELYREIPGAAHTWTYVESQFTPMLDFLGV